MKNTRRFITVDHNHMLGFTVLVRATIDGFRRERRYGMELESSRQPVSKASMNRMRRVLNNCCTIDGSEFNAEAEAMSTTYEYLPDVPFGEYAAHIDAGASNPLAILNVLRKLAYRHVIVEKQGMSELYDDPAYVLMFTQILYLSFGQMAPVDKYSTALRELDK